MDSITKSIIEGNIDELCEYLRTGVSLKEISGLGEVSARYGNLSAVKCLLPLADDINFFRHALMAAIREAHYDIVITLIENGIDINITKNIYQLTPLHLACHFGGVDIARALMDFRCDINAGDKDCSVIPLYEVCWHGDDDTLKMLISHGCDIHRKDSNGTTPLHIACIYGRANIALELIEHGADVKLKDGGGRTPLHFASYYRDPRVFSAEDAYRVPPVISELSTAIKEKNYEKTTFLLQSGIKSIFPIMFEKRNFSFWNSYCNYYSNHRMENIPLILAAIWGDVKSVELLLNFQNEVNFKDDCGRTALFYASVCGHVKVVRRLIESGALVNCRDRDMNTPLHEAVRFCWKEVVRELVRCGGDYDMKNSDKLSARDMVCERMETENEQRRLLYVEMLETMDNFEKSEESDKALKAATGSDDASTSQQL